MQQSPQGRRRRTLAPRIVSFFVVAPVAVGLVGCGDDAPTAAVQLQPASTTTTSAPTGPSSTVTPATDATGTSTTTKPVPSSSVPEPSADVLADGTSFGYLESIDTKARTIRFDLAQLFEGDAAVAAAKADGQIPADQDFIENDYYIRNVNPKLRTVPLASGVTIKVLMNPGSPDESTGNLTTLAGNLADYPKMPVTLVVSGGKVNSLTEVFFP